MPKTPSFGWIPDLPDFRDYGSDLFGTNLSDINPLDIDIPKPDVGISFTNLDPKKFPKQVSLKQYCTPVETQGRIGSCTAHAGASLVEYYENRNHGSYIPASRLFLYKVTRNYMQMTGDTGANPRSTMAAMVLFGVPPESHYPYEISDYDKEPPAFCYSFAQNYKTVKFFRHDLARPKLSRQNVLKSLKTSLANGVPFMFGFTVYSSISSAAETGIIPMPGKMDRRLGGHAVAAFGYDDEAVIKHPYMTRQKPSKGAFLIQNSWGEQWGQKGYGWLPYDYVLSGLAVDFWSIIKKEWVNTDEFSSINVS